ncbi:MAG: thiamine pyrophosphate-dependent enzyme [Nanoarchaeota archaeon]|nr:thiamine pyrophosphate-dependent enzyme [Nanoarchaeota archaeon]
MNKYEIIGSGKRVFDLKENELIILERELIDFERYIADLWDDSKLSYPVHLSGGNEKQLFEIFKDIKKEDYVLSNHRGHYHYLLAGGSPKKLEEFILRGDSMHLLDKSINFLTSSIVAGMPAIAAGIAKALKEKKKTNKVWCFVGDGAEEEGHFYEAVRYVDGWDLPCTFIIEDNDRSVETPKSERYNKSEIIWPSCVKRSQYKPIYPHVGTGKWIVFPNSEKSDGGVGGTLS